MDEKKIAPQSQNEKPILNSKERAGFLMGICERSVDNLIKSGELASVKIGRRRLIPTSAIEAFARRNAQ